MIWIRFWLSYGHGQSGRHHEGGLHMALALWSFSVVIWHCIGFHGME